MAATKKTRRSPARTERMDISIARIDWTLLRRRAKRLYHGDIVAVIAEGIERVRQEEGRQALLAWLDGADAGAEEPERIRVELLLAQEEERDAAARELIASSPPEARGTAKEVGALRQQWSTPHVPRPRKRPRAR
jgi:hypothetical protein